jgi:hypothetical protein
VKRWAAADIGRFAAGVTFRRDRRRPVDIRPRPVDKDVASSLIPSSSDRSRRSTKPTSSLFTGLRQG